MISPDELTPVSAVRPATTTAVARLLISQALQLKGVRDRTAEKELAAMRRENKDKRERKQQEQLAVWQDD